MNILFNLQKMMAKSKSLSKQEEAISKRADKEIDKIINQREDELRAVRDKWEKVEDKAKNNKIDSLAPITLKHALVDGSIENMKDNLLITRVAVKGNKLLPFRNSDILLESCNLNFMRVDFSVSPPNYRCSKEELVVAVNCGRLQEIIKKSLGWKWDGVILRKRFDTKEELQEYLIINKDKIIKPIYAEDNRLTDIAQDTDYIKAVIEYYDMTQVWERWSGEQVINLAKGGVTTTISDWGCEGAKVTITHIEGDKFEVVVKKGKKIPKRSTLEERIKSHLDHGIYFCPNPELIWK
jgi:hypothetical protein